MGDTRSRKEGISLNVRRLILSWITLSVIVGCWKGYLAVYREGQTEPWQIYPCKVASLPEADRLALEEGIPVRSPRALQQLLEDYLS